MSDLKRCREAFDKYVKDFPETRHDYGTFVAGWISRAADGWRPIETAPKDGTRLLMCFAPMYYPFTGWFDGMIWVSVGEFESDPPIVAGPTHWRPLPDPPQPPRSMDEGDMARDLQQETESLASDNPRADDVIDRQTIIDIINRHEYQLSDGFGYYGEGSQAVCDIADEILKVMRPLPDPPRKDDGHE
jgi:hypothetical protein